MREENKLSKSEYTRYDLLIRNFEGKEIEFLYHNGEWWVTAKTLGIGLEHKDPYNSIIELYFKYREEIKAKNSSIINLVTGTETEEIYIFNRSGTLDLLTISDQPLARSFAKWMIFVLEDLKSLGPVLEKISPNEYIQDQFEEKDINFIKKEDTIWIPSSSIADGLEIANRNINQIFQNNKALLKDHSTIMLNMMVGNKRRDVRVFDKTGFIWICVKSRSPKAIPFQKWVLNVIDNVVKKGYHIEKYKVGSSQWIIQQIDMMKAIAVIQFKQEEKTKLLEDKVNNVDIELKSFEQKYEDEKIITPQSRKEISDLINIATEKTGKKWPHYYHKIFDKFNIGTTQNITEKLARKIIGWIQRNQVYFIYGNKRFSNLNKHLNQSEVIQ